MKLTCFAQVTKIMFGVASALLEGVATLILASLKKAIE